MTDATVASPDGLELRSKPLASARLSRKAVFGVIGALALIMGVVIVNVSKGKPVKAAEAATKEFQPDLIDAKDLNDRVVDFPPPEPIKMPELEEQSSAKPAGKSRDEDARWADTPVVKFSDKEKTDEHGVTATQAAQGGSREDDPVQIAPEDGAASGPRGRARQAMNWGAGSNTAGGAFAGLEREGGAEEGGLMRVADQHGAAEADRDLNQQAAKESFTSRARESTATLNSQLKAPVSPYELQAGTVIPALLITAINSDLPGEIVAQVAQNVYDTATGQYLLIPQGSRLFGRYDSKVTFGQGRALVTWERLAYPNAYTLDLGGMSGHDPGGEAGLKDKVNHHYARIFGWALLTSALSAGAQLSQPQQSNSIYPSSGQVAAAAVGQQMTQLGAQMASRNMQIQPTIEIRKGYRLTIMVNKDVVFPGSYAP